MRVTVDLDTKDFKQLQKTVLAGMSFRDRRGKPFGVPNEIYKTRKGYHITWRGLDLSQEEAMAIRSIIGDDEARVIFDLFTEPKQVLFRKKKRKKVKRRWYDDI